MKSARALHQLVLFLLWLPRNAHGSPFNSDPTEATDKRTFEPLTTEPVQLNDLKFTFLEYRIGLQFQAIAGTFVVGVGFFGNILTLVVLTRSFPRNSSTIFLVQLAAADLGVICVGQLSRNFPRAWIDFDTANQHPWICKLWFFVNHSFKTISGWTLAAVTMERVIVVYMPLKSKSICTRRRAFKAITAIDVVSMASYLHYFWTYGSRYNNQGELEAGCTIMNHIPELAFYITQVRPWQDLFMRTGGPFGVLLVCNCLIVAKLLQQVKRRRELASSGLEDTKTRSTTRMLLSVSFAFLLLVSPMQIMYLIDRSDPYGWVIRQRWQAVASLRWAITIPLYYANHAINFILYCLSGHEFRRGLISLAKKTPSCCQKNISNQPADNSSVVSSFSISVVSPNDGRL